MKEAWELTTPNVLEFALFLMCCYLQDQFGDSACWGLGSQGQVPEVVTDGYLGICDRGDHSFGFCNSTTSLSLDHL